MADDFLKLSPQYQQDLLERYGGRQPQAISYGTVRDYCDSADVIPSLSGLQGDLKDYQRPAALKGILGLLPPGGQLLEIGAGDPYVAHMLQQIGYGVTIIDPYDGTGRGPTEFDYYRQTYPNLSFIRDFFSADVAELKPATFDCIYSISVLEHVPAANLHSLFQGIRRYVRPGGFSFHLIDHVTAGGDADFHVMHLGQIVAYQAALNGRTAEQTVGDLISLLARASNDLDTYYLSAEGHNRWRGKVSYDAFPFRRVISVHSCEKLVPVA